MVFDLYVIFQVLLCHLDLRAYFTNCYQFIYLSVILLVNKLTITIGNRTVYKLRKRKTKSRKIFHRTWPPLFLWIENSTKSRKKSKNFSFFTDTNYCIWLKYLFKNINWRIDVTRKSFQLLFYQFCSVFERKQYWLSPILFIILALSEEKKATY